MSQRSNRSSVELYHFIRNYVPKGWIGPVYEYDFSPLVSEGDFEIICEGKIPVAKEYGKWYIKAAIEEWQRKEGIL